MSAATTIGVIGLGEAGSAIASGLVAAGARVRGWDPVAEMPDGVEAASDAADTCTGADVVLSLNSAAVAIEVARSAAPALDAGQLYADLNTSGPALKRELAEVVASGGAAFADVALMAAVPRRGVGTPALAAGPGAERFAALLVPLGMPVTRVGGEVGAAATCKLVRSVFTKGLAAAIGEALAAAERLGCEGWAYADIEHSLIEADAALMRRLIEGSRSHAERRVEEMAAAAEMLTELGVEPRITAATEAWLRTL